MVPISPPKYEYLYGMAWTVGRKYEREERRERNTEAEQVAIILMLNHTYLSSNKNVFLRCAKLVCKVFDNYECLPTLNLFYQ